MTYYETLGIPWDASSNAIRDAYRRLVRRYHPDITGSGSADKFREVQEAYETLGQSARRRAYDRRLRTPAHAVPVTVIRSSRPSRYAEPLVPSRPDFRSDPFSEIEQIFAQFFRWFEEDPF
jgi:curved DNA-binding protein CbpA